MPFALPPLYPILDASYFPPDPASRRPFLTQTIRALAASGVTLLQLREKSATSAQILADALTIHEAAPSAMTLILNDRADLLEAASFHGLHLGQSDLPIYEARAAYPEAILGLSTHSEEQAAQPNGADYLAIGPIFATTSKPDAEPAVGLEGLRKARAATAKPLVAIGGITLGNAKQVWAAGADSIAVLSALFQPERTPAEAARDFLRLFRYNSM